MGKSFLNVVYPDHANKRFRQLPPWTAPAFFSISTSLPHRSTASLADADHGGAQVAQLVEQGTENPRVGGSNPSLGTIFHAP